MNKIMNQSSNNHSKRRLALIIGMGLILMAFIAAFSAPVISGMFVSGSASLASPQVMYSFSNFTGAVIGWVGIFVLDILVSIGVYQFYKNENPKEALITTLLRLIYSAFLGVAILQLLQLSDATPAMDIYEHVNRFDVIWSWGLIAFGLHLITLGILFNNEGGKKWISITIKALLIIAGLGYMILNIGILIVPNPVAFKACIQPLFLIPFILGEVLFAVWMIVKGGKE